ncbi:hypothetical protein [Aquamicrobium terrae]|uniref:Uncharacterized protein n=1 Tax=Aquamicrobium terrae TaxID=1324945 RepID=A0ABV2N1K3_9HYPH
MTTDQENRMTKASPGVLPAAGRDVRSTFLPASASARSTIKLIDASVEVAATEHES